MAKIWKVPCKWCNKGFVYSDHVVQKSSKRLGHSAPEYCDNCGKKHRRIKKSLGMKYFHRGPRIIANFDGDVGSCASIFHPERLHVPEVIPHTFDPKKFGVTEEQIREVFRWFEDPAHQVAILIAGTGAGKSTALPYTLIYPPEGERADLFTEHGTIMVTQPRIEAASGVSNYVSELIGCHVGKGQMVGVRHSKSRDTADFNNMVSYATEGSVLNYLKQGQLAQISTLIIDEAHERSLNIDVILRLVKRRLKQFPHLKVIITSATIDEMMFRDFFGTHTATVIHLSGEQRKFQIIHSFADEGERLPYEDLARLRRIVVNRALKKAQDLFIGMSKGTVKKGYMLVFLYSIRSIKAAVEEMTAFFDSNDYFAGKAIAMQLHSKMSREEQERAVRATPDKEFKVVFSTNLAETSLTIDKLMHVVDAGIINENQWDPRTQTEMIVPVLHSKSGCRQRWGRVGRKEDGYAYCLYTEEQFNALFPEHTTPEIQRSNLQPVSLALKSAGIGGIDGDGWLAMPDKSEIERSDRVLMQQGFLDEDGDITTHGDTLMRFMDAMDVAPLITAAIRYGCAVEMAAVLPVLSFGGKRDLLLWDRQWDVYRKYEVHNRQMFLMRDCADDVDFVLRIMKIFFAARDESHRKSIAEYFSLNYAVIKEVMKDRDSILQKMQSSMKDLDLSGIREIDFALADAVRIIFSFYLPVYRKISQSCSSKKYVFQMSGRDADDDLCASNISCYEDWIARFQDIQKLSSPFVALAQFIFDTKKSVDATAVEGKCSFVAKIIQTCFDVTEQESLARDAIFEEKNIVNKSQKTFQEGKIYGCYIVETINFPYDSEVAFIIESRLHNACGLLSSNDMSFVPAGAFMSGYFGGICAERDYPSEAAVKAEVWGFSDGGYPLFSLLRSAETILHGHFEKWSQEGKYCMQMGKVVEIRDNGFLAILLDASDMGKGNFFVVSAHEKTYPGDVNDYALGEQCYVTVFSQKSKKPFIMLEKKGAEVEMLIQKGYLSNSFSVEGNKMSFAGWMSSVDLVQAKKRLGDIVAGDLLDKLYRYSNQMSVKEVVSVRKTEELQKKYPDGMIIDDVKIVDVFPFGIRVSVGEDVFGIVHAKEMYGFMDDCTKHLHKDESVNVRILSYDTSRNQFILSMKVPGNWNPFDEYQVGCLYDGVVTEVLANGLLVNLDQHVRGFVSLREMYGWTETASMVASVGDNVQVCVKLIDEDANRVALSMKTPRHNIFDHFGVGMEVDGEIVAMESFGLRVRIHERIIGLVHRSKMYTKSMNDFSVGQNVDVEIIGIDAEEGRVDLSMLLPQYDPRNMEEGMEFRGIVTGSKNNLGWFVKIGNGISGLVHIRRIGEYVKDVDDIANVGDEVNVRIIEVSEEGRIQLTFC